MRIRDEGLTVWAAESLKPGADIVSSLSKAIGASRAVLVVLSDRTSKSGWVIAEAALALSHRDKLVVPIFATKSAEMPFIRRPFKAVDLSDDATFEDATHQLASFLKQQPDVQAQDPSARFVRVVFYAAQLTHEVTLSAAFRSTSTGIENVMPWAGWVIHSA